MKNPGQKYEPEITLNMEFKDQSMHLQLFSINMYICVAIS